MVEHRQTPNRNQIASERSVCFSRNGFPFAIVEWQLRLLLYKALEDPHQRIRESFSQVLMMRRGSSRKSERILSLLHFSSSSPSISASVSWCETAFPLLFCFIRIPFRIFSRAKAEGTGIWISESNRPGLLKDSSSEFGRFVAARTITREGEEEGEEVLSSEEDEDDVSVSCRESSSARSDPTIRFSVPVVASSRLGHNASLKKVKTT